VKVDKKRPSPARGKLEGKIALITGAASGMGATAAQLFAAEGARVIVNDVSSAGEGVAEGIRTSGGDALYIRSDVSDTKQVQRMMARIAKVYGRLDVLYNNAGIGPPQDTKVHDLDEAVWDRVLSVNVRGMFLCSKYAIRLMLDKPRRGASIVNTASISGIIGNSTVHASAYTVSKGAVMALTRQIAVSYAAEGIRCNAVCPGPIETPILAPFFARPGIRRRFEKRVPLGRIGQPEDVARLALFLASDDSSFMTGSFVVIDGGVTSV